jgi:hypothetical protein
MITKKLQPILSFVLALLLVVLQPHFAGANLTLSNSTLSENSDLINLVFNAKKPPETGKPGKQEGAGTRGPCDTIDTVSDDPLFDKLIALVPATKSQSSSNPIDKDATDVWGKTIAERPELLFYIPAAATKAKLAEFELENLSKTAIALPKTPGIISILSPSLQAGGWYHWSLSVYCDPQKSPQSNFTVDGWIERVKLDSATTNELKTATPENQVVIYAREGIWFEAIAQLAKLQSSAVKDAAIAWEKLLKYIGWEQLAKQPILFKGN